MKTFQTCTEKSYSKESANVPILDIPGVDTKKGLALYGGDTGVYIGILRAFIPDALNVAEKLRNVSEETLPDYAVSVHGLKGISAAICAGDVRQMAARLEASAKAGDLVEVLAANGALLKETETLVSHIKNSIGEFDKVYPLPRLPRPDRVVLARLLKSCDAYDMAGIDKAMAELEKFDYEHSSSLVTWLREKINNTDIAEVVSRLSAYEEIPE